MKLYELQMHKRRIGVGRNYVVEREDSRSCEKVKIEILLCKNNQIVNKTIEKKVKYCKMQVMNEIIRIGNIHQ